MATSSRPTVSQVVWTVLSLALLTVLLVWVLPRVLGTGWDAIGHALITLPAGVVIGAVTLGLLALVLEAVAVRVALPGVRFVPAARAHWASSALSLVVPGGSVLGLGVTGAVLHRAGARRRTIFTGIATFSVVDVLIGGILMPVLGVFSYAVLSAAHDLPGTAWAIVVTVLGVLLSALVLALALHRRTFAGLLDTAGGVLPGDRDLGEILHVRDEVVALLRRRPVALLLPVLLARGAQFGVLLLAASATGIDLGPFTLAGIFAIARTVALVPLTPGGSGLTETVVGALLVALGASAADAAVPALLLSLATVVVPVVLGAVAAAVPVGGRGSSAATTESDDAAGPDGATGTDGTDGTRGTAGPEGTDQPGSASRN